MIKNLAEYFESEHEYYLDSVAYKRYSTIDQKIDYLLNCNDNFETKVNDDTVELRITRTLKFEPEGVFELSVSYGAILRFNKEKKSEYDWNAIKLAEEFRENGQFVTGNLLNRIVLLVAEITSSFGQSPIVLPPLIKNEK